MELNPIRWVLAASVVLIAVFGTLTMRRGGRAGRLCPPRGSGRYSIQRGFVEPATMPDWLRTFVELNPITHLVAGRLRPPRFGPVATASSASVPVACSSTWFPW